MNPLHCEILNTLDTFGRSEWTTRQVLEHIEAERGDLSDMPSLRRIQEALKTLHEQGKAERRKSYGKGRVRPYIYRAKQQEYINPSYTAAGYALTELLKVCPYPPIFLTVVLVGIGFIDIVKWIIN